MNVGDILCLKTTGEKVQVIGLNATSVNIRRASMTEQDGLKHNNESFYEFELETLDAHAQRQIDEQKLKVEANEALDAWMASRAQVPEPTATPSKAN